jgi:hypothetical protein
MFQNTLVQPTEMKQLSLAEARQKAPAIFAEKPADYINLKRYKFTPTTEIISHLDSMGWKLTDAKQSKTNVELRRDYGVHITQFQNPELFIKDGDGGIEARPTLVLVNSHDGSRPINFEMGLFRLVCSNGLVVKDKDFGGFKERHTKYTYTEVQNLIDQKMNELPTTIANINRWNGIEMSAKDRRAFAIEALALRINSDRQPEDYEIMDILEPKRKADAPNTLWHVFNRCQENIIKGGYQMNNRTARPITNPIQDLVLNQGLWQIADRFATV